MGNPYGNTWRPRSLSQYWLLKDTIPPAKNHSLRKTNMRVLESLDADRLALLVVYEVHSGQFHYHRIAIPELKTFFAHAAHDLFRWDAVDLHAPGTHEYYSSMSPMEFEMKVRLA